jgi:exopolysaccharide biosynthesis polyprenyl glycosylphosphotransferase
MTKKLKQPLLLLGDTACLYLSLYLVLAFRYGTRFGMEVWEQHFLPFTLVFLVWLIVFYITEFYSLALVVRIEELLRDFFRVMLLNAAVAVGFFYLAPWFAVTPKTNLFLVIVVFSLLFTAWRLICSKVLRSIGATSGLLIMGLSNSSLELARKILTYPELGYRIEAIFNRGRRPIPGWLRKSGVVVKRSLPSLKNLLRKGDVGLVVVDNDLYPKIFKDLYELIPTGVSFRDLSTFWEEFDQSIPIFATGEVWFLENLQGVKKRFYEVRKRVLDIVGALLFLPAYLSLFPFIALGTKLSGPPGPVFYRQKRVGKDGKAFEVVKFRTMIPNAEKKGHPQWAKKNDSRTTRFGKLLRLTRLDELPQLANVLRGEMSFIGPRPERPQFVKVLTQKIPHYHLRHLIRPGLTGWAQINYPYGSSVDDAAKKLRYDLYYLKNRSLLLDTEIILKTIAVVFSRKGR